MARDLNLQRGLEDLTEYLPDEIIGRYKRTSFKTPSALEASVSPFLKEGQVGFSVNFYAQFLDEGTKFITGQEFIQPVLDDDNGMIEEILLISFEKDIDDAIQQTTEQGPGNFT